MPGSKECNMQLQNACGICLLCLNNYEPCGFSTFLYVAMVTHVAPCGVLHKLRNVTSGTKQRDSYIFFMLTFVQRVRFSWRIYSEEWSVSRSRIVARNMAIVMSEEHTSVVHARRCDNFWSNVMQLSRVRSPLVSPVRKTPRG